MTTSPDRPALAATLHDPDGRLCALARERLPELRPLYGTMVFTCSSATHPALLALLRENGGRILLQSDQPPGIESLGRVRLRLVQAAAELAPYIHLCDFDRLLHWMGNYPAELETTLKTITAHDFLVIGRTERAFATHPRVQQETESLFNRVFQLVAGRAWDVGAGSRGLSRRAVALLAEHAHEPSLGADAEWPLILGRFPGLRIGYVEVEGLEFETADRYAAEVEEAGGLEAWKRTLDQSPERWAYRLHVAYLIAAAAVRTTRGE